jgi:hypothetical protein
MDDRPILLTYRKDNYTTYAWLNSEEELCQFIKDEEIKETDILECMKIEQCERIIV